MSKRAIVIYAAFSQLLAAPSVHADFSNCGMPGQSFLASMNGKSYFELAAAYVDSCANESKLFQEGQVWIKRVRSADDNNRNERVRQSLQLTQKQFEEQFDREVNVSQSAKSAMESSLRCEIAGTRSDEAIRAENCDTDYFEYDPIGTISNPNWKPLKDTSYVFDNAFILPFLQESNGCSTKTVGDTDCDEMFQEEFLPVLEYQSVVYKQLVPAANNQPAEEIETNYASSHKKWKSYLSDTGFQYPWELAFNRWKRGGIQEIAQREEAPTSRYIIAHPSVALAYSDESPDGDKVQAVAVMKVLGYKWWQFNGDKAENVWGVSAVAAIGDFAEVDDDGYGLMFEYNKFALAWTDHGGESVFSLSVDLVSLLVEKPDSLEGWLAKLD
ncbi:hypothetical protein [Pseudohalioglobus lutimaris]|uniref:DUF1311 domain-containing protein n=1 Tax=Pseudohalioglobus lutimaris TaxID=1737061 RepID=A0A2N5WZT4_9GAMM|nr:hypothetical protein [Pseudohalioglobus lutimaris]PLW67753.1 hypothetical protein C0039_15140 [Pseudohalioglobus lutimaris]